MKTTLIITTYNWHPALKAVLLSVLAQRTLPDEIIIADDGSSAETAELITSMRPHFSIPVIHSWQEDKGFRVSRSRNKAIAQASHEYIILIDGDIVLDKHFISDHINIAEAGYFVTGKRVKLAQGITDDILNAKAPQISKLCFFSKGIARGRDLALRCLWLHQKTSKTAVNSIKGIHSCNMAFWLEDAMEVNGFNAEFEGWGPEDQEFAQRLINSGKQRKIAKYYAVGYHLSHKENCRGNLQANENLLKQIQQQRTRACKLGLNEFTPQG
ncbi:glycosyltransferase family 2 protein [Shewanella gaetbuli]|uniref:Glycosyltransferase family 2 protein n=1 Tax=Shewanella gaetbuli TaxID=220752 RepID=A0A9X2CGU0_9GAMM|nr:glycosyltransferase family 2 protein [Shewanella gaetbuli]MCL1142758.1 glycosyltransferase family 2 protein [Shewanella gaetbuli]